MKTAIQKNKTTVDRTSLGFAVVTVTADGEYLVHEKIFSVFRDQQLADLFSNILEVGEINTDHWRSSSEDDPDYNPEEPEVSEYAKVSYDHDDYWN
tara:strand:- start:51 stop:338 length:288 start_codon:yes stop_codon:yes gene_type:complete